MERKIREYEATKTILVLVALCALTCGFVPGAAVIVTVIAGAWLIMTCILQILEMRKLPKSEREELLRKL